MRSSRLRGFILPTSLLVLTLLTVMLTAAFVLVSAEFRSTENSMAGTRAIAIAQAGLQSYFSSSRSLTPSDSYDSLRYAHSGGYADVVARKMRLDTSGVTQWVIRSTGTTTDPLLPGQITARRIIGQMATLNPVNLPARAAMVAINGVNLSGAGANPLDGSNWPAPGICTLPAGSVDTASVTTFFGGYVASSGSAPIGSVETLASWNAVFDSSHIDWTEILAGNFTPDYLATSASLPPSGNSTWTVGYAAGNLSIPGASTSFAFQSSARAGVLIVAGDLTINHFTHWDGIIIVGGRILTPSLWSTQYMIHGMVITGLNCITGSCPAANQLYRGGSGGPGATNGSPYRSIAWSYCWANKGIQLLTTMQPRKNTFIDNWAAY